jgi:anti-sigma regulatory factor (Ser/Thr protein kinase)
MEITRVPPPLFFNINDRSQVGEARRAVNLFAESCGFGNTRSAAVGIIITELANNLVTHSGNALIAVQCLSTANGDCIEILSIDRGPGMRDVGKCLLDGFTTTSTPGNGLGAVKRLSDEFDIFSIAEQGTVILSRVLRDVPTLRSSEVPLSWGVYSRPAPGEVACGDSWRVDWTPERPRFMIADGLGHGPVAAEAAAAVSEIFDSERSLTPTQFLSAAHRRATGTRGAAVAIAHVELPARRVQYAGIGNITGTLVEGEITRGLFSHNGTVGVLVRKMHSFEYMLPLHGLLIMHSDGIRSRWSLANYPGLQFRHPAIIAAVLARDFDRERDDLTVLVARAEGGNGE